MSIYQTTTLIATNPPVPPVHGLPALTPPTTHRITLYTVTEPRKPGAEANRSRIQRTVFTTPFFPKNHKVLYFALFLSGLCTVCIMTAISLVPATYCCLFVFNHLLILSHPLAFPCFLFSVLGWTGLALCIKRHLFHRPVHPRCLVILPITRYRFSWCFV
jgi:hypothetical protein